MFYSTTGGDVQLTIVQLHWRLRLEDGLGIGVPEQPGGLSQIAVSKQQKKANKFYLPSKLQSSDRNIVSENCNNVSLAEFTKPWQG